jgi:hypothetical protein
VHRFTPRQNLNRLLGREHLPAAEGKPATLIGHNAVGGAVHQEKRNRPRRATVLDKLDGQTGCDCGRRSEQLRCLAHEPERHHAAIGESGDIEAVRIGNPGVYQVSDEPAQERNVIHVPDRPCSRERSSVIPLCSHRARIDGGEPFAVYERLQAHAYRGLACVDQCAVQRDDGR